MDQLLSNLVNIIVKTCHPQNIFLFGSRASGKFDGESDIDLCVVLGSEKERKRDIQRKIRKALISETPYDFSLDLLIYTSEEFMERVKAASSLAHKISREGVKIYG